MSTTSVKARAEKKVKRQKQFIAVGSVVVLAILGFEMTKLLSHGEQASSALTTTSSSVAGAAPSSPLPDTDRLVIQRNSDQLLSFGLFKSKDPFVQQLATTPSAPVPAVAPTASPSLTKTTTTTTAPSTPIGVGLTPATTTTAAPLPGTPTQPTATNPVVPGTTSPSTSTAPESAPTSVLIATNAVCESISLKGTFPSGADIFRLVSIAPDGKSVEIGVVGGSYDSGQATATLKLGAKLTLVNTADGTRYVISLQSKCDPAQQAAHSGTTPATTSPSTTPGPAAPAVTTTPATTTPIVTDPLDTTTAPFG